MCGGAVVTLKPHIRQVVMAGHSSHEVTQLLQAWGDGDERALEKLTPLVYGELHQLAQRGWRSVWPHPTDHGAGA